MLAAHASCIGESAAHVLQSILPILPINTLLKQSYTNPLDSHAICTRGPESNWTSCLVTLRGHSGWVLSVAHSPDGGLLASASASKDQASSYLHMTKVLQSLSPLYVHSTDTQSRSLVHNAHTGQLVQADGKSSFPEINHDQHLFTLEGHWLCAGAAYIFYLPLPFLVSTWKHQGSFACFGSQGGDMLILDVSPAINKLATM